MASLISMASSLVKSGASASTHAPGLSTLPVIARRQHSARWVGATAAPIWSIPRPDTRAEARPVANRRAARRISSAGTPQVTATASGASGATARASSSKPEHHASTNEAS